MALPVNIRRKSWYAHYDSAVANSKAIYSIRFNQRTLWLDHVIENGRRNGENRARDETNRNDDDRSRRCGEKQSEETRLLGSTSIGIDSDASRRSFVVAQRGGPQMRRIAKDQAIRRRLVEHAHTRSAGSPNCKRGPPYGTGPLFSQPDGIDRARILYERLVKWFPMSGRFWRIYIEHEVTVCTLDKIQLGISRIKHPLRSAYACDKVVVFLRDFRGGGAWAWECVNIHFRSSLRMSTYPALMS